MSDGESMSRFAARPIDDMAVSWESFVLSGVLRRSPLICREGNTNALPRAVGYKGLGESRIVNDANVTCNV